MSQSGYRVDRVMNVIMIVKVYSRGGQRVGGMGGRDGGGAPEKLSLI